MGKRYLKFNDGSAEAGWEFAAPKDLEQYEKLEELFDAVVKAARVYLKYVRQRSNPIPEPRREP